ncbi:hypothetical protein ACS0TY_010039 [Phlomoides rotata]
MAETPSKRLREESHEDSNSKRQKPYNIILNFLDEPEPAQEPSHELSQDLSAIFTILQQELTTTPTIDFEPPQSTAAEELSLNQDGGDEDESVKSVMRHLLEASDDELGIPNPRDENNFVEELNYSGENFPFAFNDSGLWELEDEAANYYTVLQSELFM